MTRSLSAMRRKVENWLRQGISPERLALTLAVGFAIGCIPMIGVPTALCLMVGLGFRLNVPAIQAANYAAMPVQLALIFPFMRLGRWLFASGSTPSLSRSLITHSSPIKLIWASGNLAGQALGAWLLTAIPSVVLMTLALTVLFRRVPVLAKLEAGD